MNAIERFEVSIQSRLRSVAETVDREGDRGTGSCKQSEWDAGFRVIPGYYPDEQVHLLTIDLADEKWLHSATISAQYQLTKEALMYNSFWLDQFEGYQDHDPIKADLIFHVVDVSWLPEGVS